MEKTNFCILLFFLIILSSLCNSQDYEYENYKYDDDYNYNENYDDYSQELNDYYGQNLLAPAPLPIPPPAPPPTPQKIEKIDEGRIYTYWQLKTKTVITLFL